jgi:hypothetical protein
VELADAVAAAHVHDVDDADQKQSRAIDALLNAAQRRALASPLYFLRKSWHLSRENSVKASVKRLLLLSTTMAAVNFLMTLRI